MTQLEYLIKLKEAREIAHQQKWEEIYNKRKDQMIKKMFIICLIFCSLAAAKCQAYWVTTYVCPKGCYEGASTTCPWCHASCEADYEWVEES